VPSHTSLLFTIPSPQTRGEGDAVGVDVGDAVGDDVGDAVGDSVGDGEALPFIPPFAWPIVTPQLLNTKTNIIRTNIQIIPVFFIYITLNFFIFGLFMFSIPFSILVYKAFCFFQYTIIPPAHPLPPTPPASLFVWYKKVFILKQYSYIICSKI
jgi:hypothetical protein